MSNRKGDAKLLHNAVYQLMRFHGWTQETFIEYTQGGEFKKLQKKAEGAKVKRERFDRKRKQRELEQPAPLEAGIAWIAYSSWFGGTYEVLQGEVIVGPRGGRTVKYGEPRFDSKDCVEYIKRPVLERGSRCWRISSYPIFASRVEAELHLEYEQQRALKFAEDRLQDGLPDDIKELRVVVQNNHPDKNPSADLELYQRATAKLKIVRITQ